MRVELFTYQKEHKCPSLTSCYVLSYDKGQLVWVEWNVGGRDKTKTSLWIAADACG